MISFCDVVADEFQSNYKECEILPRLSPCPTFPPRVGASNAAARTRRAAPPRRSRTIKVFLKEVKSPVATVSAAPKFAELKDRRNSWRLGWEVDAFFPAELSSAGGVLQHLLAVLCCNAQPLLGIRAGGGKSMNVYRQFRAVDGTVLA